MRMHARARSWPVFPCAAAAWSGLLLGVLFLCCAHSCPAQFTGPAFGAASPANREVQPTTDPALLNPVNPDFQIQIGDLLTVKLFGVTDFAPPVRVSRDGTVQLPLVGLVPVAGLNVHGAEDRIAERLIAAGMYRNPQVTIQTTESPSQFASVTGELHALVPIAGERHLLDVIASAGSLPITASRIVTVLRPGVEKPIVVDLGTDATHSAKADIPIFAGDTVVISHVGVVYVVGAFKNQGAIPLEQSSPLTLLQATALSGGAGFEGKLNDLRILRTFGTERRIVPVDYSKVVRNELPDPVLQADDIVFLPSSAIKAALKNGGLGTLAGFASLLVIALQNH